VSRWSLPESTPRRRSRVDARLVLLALAVAWPISAEAGINLKNGNFYVTYTDLAIPGEMELNIARTYNAQSRYEDGMWGHGWGSDLETYLEIRDDGSLVVHENGSGADSVFDRPGASDPTVEPGTTWVYGGMRGQQRILRTTDGYLRSGAKQTEYFDEAGRLVRLSEGRAGHYISLIRGADGRVLRLLTDTGHEVKFSYDRRGHVESLDVDDGRMSAQYRYEGDWLAWSRDTSGNEYVYVHDQSGLMEQIRYSDGARLRLTYNGSTFVASVDDKQRKLTQYDYYDQLESPTERAYGTIVTTEGTTSSYDYVEAVDDKGRVYVKRIASSKESGGRRDETATDYNAAGLPIREQRGARVTEFRYDERGRMVYKDDGATVIELEYHPTLDKLTRTARRRSGSDHTDTETRYRYNQHGELEWAENHNGLWTELSYDDRGRIVAMRSSRGDLSFEYNDAGKPTTIAIAGTGKISVRYNDYGEIDSVESPQGHQTAIIVTQAFEELLTLVGPANVGL
jgi:YD repeat-containing protein